MSNTVKLSKYWRDIKFTDDSGDYEDTDQGTDYEDQPYTIEEAIMEIGSAEPSDNGLMPTYYIEDAEHNLDGSITERTICIDGTDEQLKAIKKGLKQ